MKCFAVRTLFILFPAAILAVSVTAMHPNARAASPGAVFINGPDLNEARMAHKAATLPDGRVAAFGGHGIGFNLVTTAEIWDPVNNSFTSKSMVYAHDFGAIAHLPLVGQYLLAGGMSASSGVGQSAAAEFYHPTGDTFTPVAAMNTAHAMCAAATLSNGKRVLVVGNWYAAADYGELYDWEGGGWTTVGPLSTSRAMPVVLPTSDLGALIIGGFSNYGGVNFERVEEYHASDNSFTTVRESLFDGETGWILSGNTFTRPMDAYQLIDGRYLLLANKPDTTTQYTLFTFDPATKAIVRHDTVPHLPDSSVAVFAHEPVVDQAAGKVYLLADLAPYATPRAYRLYSVDLDTWALTAPSGQWTAPSDINYVSWEAGALLQDGRIFLIGGTAGDNFMAHKRTFFAAPWEPGPEIRVGPAALLYGQVALGARKTKSLTIHNDGDLPLKVTALATHNARFRLVSAPKRPFTIAAGGSRLIKVRFTPLALGLKKANLTISNNDADEGSFKVPLQGRGVSSAY